jgi:broad specificity phosphatase PhoE
VILVTHGGALALALAALLRGRVGEWYDAMANCAVSELVLSPRPELLRFNEAGHLEGV